jgi:hypothetical protein
MPGSGTKAVALFIQFFNNGPGEWEDFEDEARKAIAAAIAKEGAAIHVLDQYLGQKDAKKQLGGDAYKEFKKAYEEIAKTL